jgi:quercetin dioxygenase-like cupin family protein
MSDEAYRRVNVQDVEARERRGGGASSRDLAGALGATALTLRLWTYGPGHAMAFHRHKTQDEVYQLVSGGPQTLRVGDQTIEVVDGDWIHLPRDTPRRIQNETDREAVWLTIGAPPGEGIMDGIRLDPETGHEIPRT